MEQDELYHRAAAEFGPAIGRLARGYEADAEQRRDLVQDIHFALWRSFAGYAGQCSLRTWVYRVAHNTAISSRLRRRGKQPALVSLEALSDLPAADDTERAVGNSQALARIAALLRKLKSPDDQVMLLYLEELDAEAIGEITGLAPGAVATRIWRIKAFLARAIAEGGGA
jgi:RNA polymerase sigma-70 factor, ECF subfamily